jgi:hypothetical protein
MVKFLVKDWSQGLWSPRSPHLSNCIFFFLCGYLKDAADENHQRIIEQQKINATNAIESISPKHFGQGFSKPNERIPACLDVPISAYCNNKNFYYQSQY